MTDISNKLQASLIAGVVEVFVTHPMDYTKTLLQKNISYKGVINEFSVNPYKGMTSRMLGVVPMRIIFWNSFSFFKNNNYNIIHSSLLTGLCQTAIDYPIEQIKIQKMLNNNNIINSFRNNNILMKGFMLTYLRNSGFILTTSYFITPTEKKNETKTNY
jgi:hypothetical protein